MANNDIKDAKIFNTRLLLKHDTLKQWRENNPLLLKGEIAIVNVPEQINEDTGEIIQKPAVLFKVGDGVKNFNDLDWVSAIAGDVPTWAKALQIKVGVDDEGNDILENIADDAFITALEDIKTLKGYFGTGGEEIGKTIPEQIAILSQEMAGYQSALENLLGDDVNSDTLTTIRKIANDELAKQLIPEEANESYNTLKEIADWIQSHPDDASAMNTSIENLLNILIGFGGEEQPSSVKQYIEDIVTTLDNNLADIAKTGNINDLQQTADDFVIFNCGTSSTIISKPTPETTE